MVTLRLSWSVQRSPDQNGNVGATTPDRGLKPMSFWLVLVLGSNVPGLHVGNYETLATCEAAAKQAVFINPSPRIAEPFYGFLCIQANEASTKPPS